VKGHRQVGVRPRQRTRGRMAFVRTVSVVAVFVSCLALSAPVVSAVEQQPPPAAAQDEFVPMKEIPPQDQLPAAPLLIAAYAVAWLVMAGYAWSLWRRLGRVERELQLLTSRLSTRGR
jgi:CcmD family protein